MPIKHRGRPPGRREDRRPGKGPALVPQRNIKHSVALAAVPAALETLDELQEAGLRPKQINTLRMLVHYARERAQQGIAKAERDAVHKPNRAISVPVWFKDSVYARADDHTHVSTVVEQRLQDFITGEWTPPAPARARRGEKPESVMINVRVSTDLWQAANDYGRDPEQIEARGGYKLTANQVAIAALAATFGWVEPKAEDSTTA